MKIAAFGPGAGSTMHGPPPASPATTSSKRSTTCWPAGPWRFRRPRRLAARSCGEDDRSRCDTTRPTRGKEVEVTKTNVSSRESGSSSVPPGGAEGNGGDSRAAAAQPVPHRYQAFGAPVADSAESVIHALERSKGLDALGQAVASAFSKVVQPGTLKDLLSGTWMGHAAHPMLTDVTIGSWTSALILDLFGGRAARSG